MNDNDKKGLIRGAMVLIAAIWGIITIGTCAGLWNAATRIEIEGFVLTSSILLFIVNAAAIYGFVKTAFKEKKEEKKDE